MVFKAGDSYGWVGSVMMVLGDGRQLAGVRLWGWIFIKIGTFTDMLSTLGNRKKISVIRLHLVMAVSSETMSQMCICCSWIWLCHQKPSHRCVHVLQPAIPHFTSLEAVFLMCTYVAVGYDYVTGSYVTDVCMCYSQLFLTSLVTSLEALFLMCT